MHTLYITDNGILLKRRSGRILLKKDSKVMEEIPILDLKRILIFGNNQISTDLMRYLSRNGIEVSFLSQRGRFNFRMVPETSKNIYLRMAQHRSYGDTDFRVSWSRIMVGAKLRNQRNMLMRGRKNQPDIGSCIDKEIDILRKCLYSMDKKASINEIMGAEGYGAKVYFSAYGRLIRNGFEFRERAFHPPPDPVNALLSFGYMLLLNEINSLLEAFGFDAYLGFLHSIRYGRASLATDLIEPFRSPIIDRLVLYLINLGVIGPSAFRDTEDKGIRMDEAAIKAYLTNYEKFMTSLFLDKQSNEQKNYRQILRENVLQLERLLLDKADYCPYFFYA